jgi:hypothetical protein
MSAPERLVKIKEQFENHPVPWGLGLIATGFIAGFGARGYMLSVSTTSLTCSIDSLSAVEEAHAKRIATLNQQLVSLESGATDRNILSSDQVRFEEAANRIRKDIEHSNSVYLSAIASLQKVCK